MTNLTVLTPPNEPPVPLALAKSFLRIGHDGDDALIASLIDAATSRIEHFAGLAFVQQVLRVEWLHWPTSITGRGVRLPRTPVRRVQTVALVTDEGVITDQSEQFRIDCGRLRLRPWSMLPPVSVTSRVRVDFVAGYESAEAVPADLREAVLRTIADLYAARPGLGQPSRQDQSLPEDVLSILSTRDEIRL